MLKKIWSWPNSRWLLGIPIGGFIMLLVGVIALGTTNYIVHETSNTEFCFSCHSHEQNIRAEYEASSHFSNVSGVRAECADCHLPQDSWFDLMATKIVVSRDIIPELMGNLDSPEKWEAHRPAMAESVWAEYRENDSAYCRSCHLPDAMVGQSRMATSMHRTARDKGRTCIDCHKGMVHKLPADRES